jgi:GTP cyclohydrolase I
MTEQEPWETDEDMARTLLSRYAGIRDDDHGIGTPKRFLSFLDELTQCRDADDQDKHIEECIKWKTFPTPGDEMIIVDGITFTSVCNHHLAPFIGVARIGYVPANRMAGLSKFARVVRHFARMPQVQERLVQDIHDFLEHKLNPNGLIVMLRAEHMCMTIRGVQAPGTMTTTTAVSGVFRDHSKTAKAEFLAMVGTPTG